MIHRLLLRTLCFCFGLFAPTAQGWDIGTEYLYDYNGLLRTALRDVVNQSAVIQIIGKLTVQSVDDETLMLKLSEIRVTRDGNYGGSGSPSDPIWLPVALADGEEEAIGDSLHLLSPFAVIHNKGSITNLVVESEEPVWSINMKKAVASHLQLDVTGVRSGVDGGVFGERNAALNSLENGVTGDCLTTLRVTRLPFYQVIQDQMVDKHQIIADICRSSKVYEITKIKDFHHCRVDPLRISSNPPSASSSPHPTRPDGALVRFAAYKYLACGDSSEKATIVHMEGVGELLFSGPTHLKTEQIVSLMLQSRGQIRDLLQPLSQPKLLDGLIFSFDNDPAVAVSFKEEESMVATLREVRQILMQSTTSEQDISKKLSIVSETAGRLDETQLHQIWQRIQQSENDNPSVRDLFVDCVAASGSPSAAAFILDLIEERELKGFQALWLLMSSGHSVRQPKVPLLRKFVNIIRSEPARVSKSLRHTALTVAADLLHRSCVLSTINCNPDTQVITEELLPLLVRELETASLPSDRLTTILALGALGVDDVLLLLVPYIRGEDVVARIAAISSLKRLMDSSSKKVIPLLSSLADNVAERAEIRMTAIGMLLFHEECPLDVWQKIAARTWFEPNYQVRSFTCDMIHSFSSIRSPEDESTSSKARSVLGLVRPCSGRSEFERYATVKGNTAGLLSLLAFWRQSNSSLPVYLHHQLLRQLGSFRLNLAQVSIWNYNTDDLWNRLLGIERPQPSGPKLNDIWDQLSLRFRPDDQRTGLFHVRLFGSTMQAFFNLDDIDPTRIVEFLTRHLNIRLVKFQQLVDIRTDVATELGLPARFSFAMTALASADGRIHQPEINVTSSFLFKWTSESRIECPFSNHHVATGLEHRVELRTPIHLTFNSSLTWMPPQRTYDLAYYHVKPYTLSRRTMEHPLGYFEQSNLISTKSPSVSVVHLSVNLRTETISELPQDDPASAWLVRLMEGDFGTFGLDGFQQRMYRLRYVPDNDPLVSISLSASSRTQTIVQEEPIKYGIGTSNTSIDWNEGSSSNDTESSSQFEQSLQIFQATITAQYNNRSLSNSSLLAITAQNLSEDNDVWNVSVYGSSIGLLCNWLNFSCIDFVIGDDGGNSTYQDEDNNKSRSNIFKIDFKVRQSDMSFLRFQSATSKEERAECFIHVDRIVTYDAVEYYYNLNECHHLLTADCGQKTTRYAITAYKNESETIVVRITLDRDVIEISSTGNISINGIEADYQDYIIRIHDDNKLVATVIRKEDSVECRLAYQNLNVIIRKTSVTISAAKHLLGQACGLCGDGDSEVTSEFKTGDRCALSSGALMAASFQVSVGPDECPSLSDEMLQALLKESYPCYSVDEQVASILPLPPESLVN